MRPGISHPYIRGREEGVENHNPSCSERVADYQRVPSFSRGFRTELARYILAGLICAGFFLALVGEARCADFGKPLAIYTSAAAVDLASTRYSMAHNGHEANLPQSLSGQVAVKTATVAALVGLDVVLQKSGHKGFAKALRITASVVWVGAAVQNVRRVK